MREIDIELPAPDPIQRQVLDHCETPGARAALVMARRRGKSKTLHLLGMRNALQGGIGWWVLPSRPMSHGVWRALRNHGHEIKKVWPGVEVREVDRMLRFPNGGELQIKSAARPETLVADAVDLVMMDEAGLIPRIAWEESLEPTLLDRDGVAVFAGTPKGYDDLLHPAYQNGLQELEGWRAWHQTFRDSPYLTAKQIKRLEERFRNGEISEKFWEQEYLAAFLDDAGAVFRKVRDACTARTLDGPEQGRRYVIGVDWGKLDDLTWFVVMDERLEVVALDRMVEINYTLQIERLKALAEVWKPEVIMAERNSMGEPLIEKLQMDGLPVHGWYSTGGKGGSKAPAVENLAALFERGEVRIPSDQVLVGQLQSYTIKRLPGGTFAYSAPSGMHDDGVIALMLAALAHTDVDQVELIM